MQLTSVNNALTLRSRGYECEEQGNSEITNSPLLDSDSCNGFSHAFAHACMYMYAIL